MDKAKLRVEARAVRRAIPAEERAARSARIREHALALPEMAEPRAVGIYVSVGSEVDTALLIRHLFARGTLVAVPLMLGDDLLFARLDHPWALGPGKHGIPEPRSPWEEVRGDELDAILIPGLRFGRNGTRLGNGGGHFDRYLSQNPAPLRVALAFQAQVVDSIPTEAHDQGMDVVVTEEGSSRAMRPAPSG